MLRWPLATRVGFLFQLGVDPRIVKAALEKMNPTPRGLAQAIARYVCHTGSVERGEHLYVLVACVAVASCVAMRIAESQCFVSSTRAFSPHSDHPGPIRTCHLR